MRCGFQPHKSPLTACFERNDLLHLSSATFCSLPPLLRYTSLRLYLIPPPQQCTVLGKRGRSAFPSRTSGRQTFPLVQLSVWAPHSLVRNNSPILFPLISFQLPVVMDCDAIPLTPTLQCASQNVYNKYGWVGGFMKSKYKSDAKCGLAKWSKNFGHDMHMPLSRFSGRHQYLCVQNVVCHSWQNRVPRE